MSEYSGEKNNKEVAQSKELRIFQTDADRFGRDITAMSDFFNGYIQQMALEIKEHSSLELVKDFPFSDLGIINDVIHHARIVATGKVMLLPDFDNLPLEMKSKLKKGIYKLGESKQVDGNLRAVIMDENGVRVKDITLKKVLNSPNSIDTVRSIGNQMQMRQLYVKLDDIQEFQEYQIEKDRDRDIVVPFLDARGLIVEAEAMTSNEEKCALLRNADGKIRTALCAVYADIETTTKRFVRRVGVPFFQSEKQINTYMGYLTSDLQLATKFVGVRMQLLEYLGEAEAAKNVLLEYQHVMYDFLTKPVSRKGLTAAELMHDYFPYDRSNMNCWYYFKNEMQPALKSSIDALRLGNGSCLNDEIYVVSLEDIADEENCT